MSFAHLLEQVRTEASNVNPRDVALTVVSAPFFLVGAVAGVALRGAWTVAAWAWAMTLVGYRVARGRD